MAETLLNLNQLNCVKRHSFWCRASNSQTIAYKFKNDFRPPWMVGNLPFEFVLTFKTSSCTYDINRNSYCGIMGSQTGGDATSGGVEILLYKDNLTTPYRVGLRMALSSNGSSWDIAEVATTLELGTWYSTLISYDLTKYTFGYKKFFDSNFTILQEVESNSKIFSAYPGIGSRASSNPVWYGMEYDIANSYMKNGNTLYWGGEDAIQFDGVNCEIFENTEYEVKKYIDYK